MQITRGKKQTAIKTVIYGVEGIGKSTFASHFPDPVFCDTEGSTKHMDVARTPSPESFQAVKEQVKYFINHPDELRTFVLDTADWAEKLCSKQICDRAKVDGIEDFGYGKGYTYLEEEFGRLLDLLEQLVERGVNVVVTAHASMRKFEQPDEMGAYDRWEMKLQKKTAALLKEWADMVLFANYKTHVVNIDNQGARKGKNKAQGGSRVMYTTHHPCWDAKNRFALPDELPFEFDVIAAMFNSVKKLENRMSDKAKSEPMPTALSNEKPSAELNLKAAFASKPKRETDQTSAQGTAQEDRQEHDPISEHVGGSVFDKFEESMDDIPGNLAEIMRMANVTPWEVRFAVASKGYFPNDMKISEYPKEFVDGCLVGAWEQMYAYILANRREMPF